MPDATRTDPNSDTKDSIVRLELPLRAVEPQDPAASLCAVVVAALDVGDLRMARDAAVGALHLMGRGDLVEHAAPRAGAPLMHRPLRPDRDGCLGEAVYTYRWHERMSAQPHAEPGGRPFDLVMDGLPGHPTQRDAVVAASFAQWLGSHLGRVFLQEARRHAVDARTEAGMRRAFAETWAMADLRRPHVNGGFRLHEGILALAEAVPPHGEPRRRPTCTQRDVEVIEQVAAWLGTDDGRMFTALCEAEIYARTATAPAQAA